VEAAAVDADDDPGVLEQEVRLLKGLYVFVPKICQSKVRLVR
jgi:hypothetical protein